MHCVHSMHAHVVVVVGRLLVTGRVEFGRAVGVEHHQTDGEDYPCGDRAREVNKRTGATLANDNHRAEAAWMLLWVRSSHGYAA